jgi:uncharacterized protein (DUF697 family)
MLGLPVRLGALRTLVKEVSAGAEKPVAVGGARELAGVLRRELGRDATPGAVRAGEAPEGAAVLVYVLGHDPSPDDAAALDRARRARVPIVVVAGADDLTIPNVLATDVVRVRAGEGFPLDEIARTIAARLGEQAAPLAGRLPVLRGAVCEQLVAAGARRNGVIGAAEFVPGADLPALALNQLRLVLRLEQAHGRAIDLRERLPELAGTLGAGVALRALARQLTARLPVPRWAVQGAVAYAGTRVLGAAAIRRLEAAPGGHQRSAT